MQIKSGFNYVSINNFKTTKMKFNKMIINGIGINAEQDVNKSTNTIYTKKESRLKTILQIVATGIAIVSLTVAIIANWDKLISFIHQVFN